jgi:prepilin-type N-terminal cleavage/methylation domain-containing protein/prepilin-type processing-associated H-X9-DG protein
MRSVGRHPHGFTLVELLVVMAIIGILISLMFPAVGAMQEASRRATCQHRLACLGMALQKYESGYGMLPPGSTDPKGPIHNLPKGIQLSWTVRLLPYLDEGGTFKQVDLAAGAYAEKNAPVRGLRIAAFVCPSQRTVRQTSAPASNYAGCHHQLEAPIAEDNHGVLFLNSHISQRDVTDGVEHTIYLGEKRTDLDDLGWMSGTRATLRNTGTPIGKTGEEQPASDLYVGGFGAEHPAGANFLFGDGAVRFVNAAIDMDVYQQLGDRADGKLLKSGPTREP